MGLKLEYFVNHVEIIVVLSVRKIKLIALSNNCDRGGLKRAGLFF